MSGCMDEWIRMSELMDYWMYELVDAWMSVWADRHTYLQTDR